MDGRRCGQHLRWVTQLRQIEQAPRFFGECLAGPIERLGAIVQDGVLSIRVPYEDVSAPKRITVE